MARILTDKERIRRFETEVIKLNRIKETWIGRYKKAMTELKQLREDNQPFLIERNKRQREIIHELQKEIQKLKNSQLQDDDLDNVNGQTVKGVNHTSPSILTKLNNGNDGIPPKEQ